MPRHWRQESEWREHMPTLVVSNPALSNDVWLMKNLQIQFLFCWIKYAVIYLRYPSPFLCSTIRFLFAAIESGCNKRFWFYWITRELQNNMNKPPNRVSIRFLHIRHSIFHIWTHFDEYNVGILSLPGTFVHPVCAWKMEILILIRCRPTYGCRNF